MCFDFLIFFNCIFVIFNKKRKRVNYLEFRNELRHFLVFSTKDILKCYPMFDSRRLVEWQEKGYLKKIINRWYYFTDTTINEEFLYLIANSIYSPSYISFETALSYYQLIPEAVYTITSATSLKTNEFNTITGTFSYRHLKPPLLFGYRLIETENYRMKIAEIEKTILDYFYINEKINTEEAFVGMRVNREALMSQLNIRKMNAYLKLYANKTLETRVNRFIQCIKNA